MQFTKVLALSTILGSLAAACLVAAASLGPCAITTDTIIRICDGDAIQQNPLEEAETSYQAGRKYSQMQTWRKAIEAYSRAIDLMPQNVDALVGRGYARLNAYLSQDLLMDSKSDFQRVLAQVPSYEDAQNGLKIVNSLLDVQFPSAKTEDKIETKVPASEETNVQREPVSKGETSVAKKSSGTCIATHTVIKICHEEEFLDAKSVEDLYNQARAQSTMQNWEKAIETFSRVLEFQPNNVDARVGRGYAYLNEYRSKTLLLYSQEDFQRVLHLTPNYKDAQEGLKRVNQLLEFLNQEPTAPKEYSSSTNSVLDEAHTSVSVPEEMHASETEKEESNALSAAAAQTASTENLKKIDFEEVLSNLGKELSRQEDHFAAKAIFEKLVASSPKNSDYLYFLGREVAALGDHCKAIKLFKEGLYYTPKYVDIWIALGNQFFFLEDLDSALDAYSWALDIDPNNTDALIKAAQVETQLGNEVDAEELFFAAWDEDPMRNETLKQLANYEYSQRHYSLSEQLFRYYADLEMDEPGLRLTLFENSSYTTPSAFLRFIAVEERERDFFTHQPVASLTTVVGDVAISYPNSDRFRTTIRLGVGNTRQKLLVSNLTQFSVKATGLELKEEWFYDPNWTFVFNGRVEWISNSKRHVELFAKNQVNFMPTVIARYNNGKDTISFGEASDSIIFRDFKRRHLLVPTRVAATFLYQRDFGNQRLIGFDTAWLWYQDPIHNQEQVYNAWLQSGVPYFEDLLSFRYQCVYRHFRKITTGYYSFDYELTHWIRARLFKRWLCGFRCELEYWHGWRTVRGRNPQQQLILGPATDLVPITTVENQIDQVFLTVGYMPTDSFDCSIQGLYYHDSFDYLVLGVKAFLEWRF